MKPEIQFVKRMTALFGPPDAAVADDVFNEYANALRGQSSDTLKRACDAIAKDRRIRAWPTVAECLDAVRDARRLPNTAAMGLERIEDFDGWWSERMARIRTATTEKQISIELDQIEPYHTARWIASHRFPDAVLAANARRLEWQGQRSTDTTRRMVGDDA